MIRIGFPSGSIGSASTAARTHLTSNRASPISLEAGDAEQIPGDRDFREAIDARAVIGPAFRRLSADQRSVLALHYGLGLSISESADAMNVRVGTAKSRLECRAARHASRSRAPVDRVVARRRPGGVAMTDRQLSSEELVADYIRSSMRFESPDGLTDEVMRAVAAAPQARRTWFSALPPYAPALARPWRLH